jgi:hypothetical protein
MVVAMPYAFYYDAPGTPEFYRRVSDRIGGNQPPGLLVQVVTSTDVGLHHLNVWESREQWEVFRDTQVRPAVAAVLQQLGLPALTQAPVEKALDLVDVIPQPAGA